jgi:hypothetical protein
MPEDVKAMRPLCSAKNAFSSFLDKPMPIIMELLHFAEAPDLIHILLTPWERWAAIEPVSNSPYTGLPIAGGREITAIFSFSS